MPRKYTPRRTPAVRRPEQLPSGSWRAWTRRPGGGKGPSKTFGSSDFTAAMAWMTQQQAILDGHLPPETGDTPAVAVATETRGQDQRPFAEYITEWAATAGGTREGRRARASVARLLATAWPDVAVAKISTSDVRKLMAAMEIEGLSRGTIRNRLSGLRACMRQAVEDGVRDSDPTQDVKIGGWVAAKVTRVPTDDEVERLLANLPYYLRPAVLLSRDSGLRLGEVAALRWQHLDLTGEYNQGNPAVQVGPILCRDNTEQPFPKGKKILWAPLSERTVTALTDLLAKHPSKPDQHVFRENQTRVRTAYGKFGTAATGYGGEQMKYQRFEYLWGQARRRAELHAPLPRWHDLRHALGHELHRADAPAQVIQAVLRHGNLATSRRYMPDVDIKQASAWTRRARHHQPPPPAKPDLRVVS